MKRTAFCVALLFVVVFFQSSLLRVQASSSSSLPSSSSSPSSDSSPSLSSCRNGGGEIDDEHQNCDQTAKTFSPAHQKYKAESNLKHESWKEYLELYESATRSYQFPQSFPYTSVIDKDLSVFKSSGISREMLDLCRQEDTHAVTYVGVGGKLYRSRDCLFPARCEGVEHFLLKALKKKDMGDFELVLNTHDWPQINRHFHAQPLPTFSFSKTEHYTDIYFPAWTFWAGGPAISHYPTGIGRWDRMSKTLKAKAEDEWPWDKKRDVAFFRGSRTSEERDELVLLSRRFPDLVDAEFTKNQAWKSKADTLGADPAAEVRLEDHCQYKYLLNFRGVAASFRFKHLFLCGSTVLHVGNEWKEFFYDALIPWVHYVPVQRNTRSDIKELVEFLRAFPHIAIDIALNGKRMIESHLRMKDVQRYWNKLLKNYAKLLTFKPTPAKDFIQIKE